MAVLYYFKPDFQDYLLNTSEYIWKHSNDNAVIIDMFDSTELPLYSQLSDEESHICLHEGLYSPLPSNYYHTIYNKSLEYNFQCPFNFSLTSIINTIKHINILPDNHYQTFIPINILFTAYDINNKRQQYGGDEFIIYAEYTVSNKRIAFQSFPVQDMLNGTYLLHLLFSIPGTYNISILHKFSCFDSMINKYTIKKVELSLNFTFLATIRILDYNLFHTTSNNTTESVNYCSSNQHTMDMLASGIWTNNGQSWEPYCVERNNNEYCKPYCCKMKKLSNSKYIQFKIGDSTLIGRTHEIAIPYTSAFDQLINIDFKKYIGNKTVILATNPNLYPVFNIENLYEACEQSMRFICDLTYYLSNSYKTNEIDVIIVGGTGVHEQLYPVNDLVTEYRVRWHDECIKNKVEMVNKIKRDITQYNDNVNICVNKSMDKILFGLKKDIWFIDINYIRMARWDVNRPHDKIHGWLNEPADLYQYAMLIRAESNDTL